MRKNKEQMMYELGWNAALEMSAVMVEKDLPGPRKTDEDEEFERIAREIIMRATDDDIQTYLPCPDCAKYKAVILQLLQENKRK